MNIKIHIIKFFWILIFVIISSNLILASTPHLERTEIKQKFVTTKDNVEKYTIIPYVEKYSEQYNISKTIVLGFITAESMGIPGIKSYDGLGAGLGQTSYVEFTSKSDWAKPLVTDKKCKRYQWEGKPSLQGKDNQSIDCQVEASIRHLLDKKRITDNDESYRKYINKFCSRTKLYNIHLSYKSENFERALRAYNGLAGCVYNDDRSEYVEIVLAYSKLWEDYFQSQPIKPSEFKNYPNAPCNFNSQPKTDPKKLIPINNNEPIEIIPVEAIKCLTVHNTTSKIPK